MSDHGCINPNTCDICQAGFIIEQEKISRFAIRETIWSGVSRKQDSNVGRKVASRHCGNQGCLREMLPSEKVCFSCGSTEIVLRYVEEAQELIVPSVDIAVMNPRLDKFGTACPFGTVT